MMQALILLSAEREVQSRERKKLLRGNDSPPFTLLPSGKGPGAIFTDGDDFLHFS